MRSLIRCLHLSLIQSFKSLPLRVSHFYISLLSLTHGLILHPPLSYLPRTVLIPHCRSHPRHLFFCLSPPLRSPPSPMLFLFLSQNTSGFTDALLSPLPCFRPTPQPYESSPFSALSSPSPSSLHMHSGLSLSLPLPNFHHQQHRHLTTT